MDIRAEAAWDRDEVLELYAAVGWTAYTDDPRSLLSALSGSHLVLAARQGRRLVGLARTISDDATICFVQDLLVHPDVHRRGVGRALLERLVVRYEHCRQFVLCTDADDPVAHAFYHAVGLVPSAQARMAVFSRPAG